VIIGAKVSADETGLTWDCWKSILHDKSIEPSNDMLLKNLVEDSRVKEVKIRKTDASDAAAVDELELILSNVWDEEFKIEFLVLPLLDNKLVCHASRIDNRGA
jgi:hypothetical protein